MCALLPEFCGESDTQRVCDKTDMGSQGEGRADSARRVRVQGMNDSQGCSREGAGQAREEKGIQA